MGSMVISAEAEDKFHARLHEIDIRAAAAVRRGGCPRGGCGGPLHTADYARRVRGLSASAEEAGGYGTRLSLCCARCRRRATPPSVRFFGRFVYAMRTLVAWALVNEARETAPPSKPAPSRQTLGRWGELWRERVPRLPSVALLVSALVVAEGGSETHLVVALAERLEGTPEVVVAQVHRLLSPLTTATVPPERARSVMVD
jgi:hypothetical protein